ncbi:MAG: hypothetical protein IJH95_00640 [Mogibacterium sp.]|nr:hypothetical protein [Mogibacterium sp.]
MASKNYRELHFQLNDEDYKAFGRYRILYTKNGRGMVRRTMLTYVIIGVGVAVLFSLFPVDEKFRYLMYAASAICILYGLLFAESNLLKQQDRAIENSKNDIERVHPATNVINFGAETFTTSAGEDSAEFRYDEIKTLDLAETAIYVWMSDTMIMTIPLHAFRNMDEMKDLYKWLKSKKEGSGRQQAE